MTIGCSSCLRLVSVRNYALGMHHSRGKNVWMVEAKLNLALNLTIHYKQLVVRELGARYTFHHLNTQVIP